MQVVIDSITKFGLFTHLNLNQLGLDVLSVDLT